MWKDGKIGTFRGIRKGAIKYRAMVFGDKGISPSGDYGYDVPKDWVAPHGEYMGYKGVATEIARFFRTEPPAGQRRRDDRTVRVHGGRPPEQGRAAASP